MSKLWIGCILLLVLVIVFLFFRQQEGLLSHNTVETELVSKVEEEQDASEKKMPKNGSDVEAIWGALGLKENGVIGMSLTGTNKTKDLSLWKANVRRSPSNTIFDQNTKSEYYIQVNTDGGNGQYSSLMTRLVIHNKSTQANGAQSLLAVGMLAPDMVLVVMKGNTKSFAGNSEMLKNNNNYSNNTINRFNIVSPLFGNILYGSKKKEISVGLGLYIFENNSLYLKFWNSSFPNNIIFRNKKSKNFFNEHLQQKLYDYLGGYKPQRAMSFFNSVEIGDRHILVYKNENISVYFAEDGIIVIEYKSNSFCLRQESLSLKIENKSEASEALLKLVDKPKQADGNAEATEAILSEQAGDDKIMEEFLPNKLGLENVLGLRINEKVNLLEVVCLTKKKNMVKNYFYMEGEYQGFYCDKQMLPSNYVMDDKYIKLEDYLTREVLDSMIKKNKFGIGKTRRFVTYYKSNIRK